MRPAPRFKPAPAWPVARWPVPPALRLSDYRRFWTGSGIAFLARWMDIAVISWVVVQITESPFLVSLVAFMRIAPFLLAGPIAGLAADRFDRLTIIRAARVSLAVVDGVFAVLLALDALALWHLYALVMLGGIIWTFDAAARQALTPDLVERRLLTNAIALDMMAFMAAQIVGSVLAGALLPVIHAHVCFAALAALLVISLLRLTRLSSPGPAESVREPFLSSLAGGVRVVRSNRILLGVLLMAAAAEGFAYTFHPLLPLFATSVLGAGSAGLGLLLAAQGIGALVAGGVVAAAGPRIRAPGRLLIMAMMLTVATGFALAGSPWLLLTFWLLVLQGLFVGTYATMQTNLVMLLAPRQARGRLVGLQMLVVGAFPITALIVGAIADALSPQAAVMIMSGIGLGIMGLMQLAVPELRRYRTEEEAPATGPQAGSDAGTAAAAGD